MKKTLILIPFLFLTLQASLKDTLQSLYNNKKYAQACKVGVNGISKYKNDETYISLYAFSCLYSDNVEQLSVPITLLYRSKEARNNASYFSIILMQKKLFLTSLVDNYPIDSMKLPSTDYVLSKVFNYYLENPHKREYIDKDDNKKLYKVDIIKENDKNILVIEEYFDNILHTRHKYY